MDIEGFYCELEKIEKPSHSCKEVETHRYFMLLQKGICTAVLCSAYLASLALNPPTMSTHHPQLVPQTPKVQADPAADPLINPPAPKLCLCVL